MTGEGFALPLCFDKKIIEVQDYIKSKEAKIIFDETRKTLDEIRSIDVDGGGIIFIH